MSYCLNPQCSKPENPANAVFCQNCGGKLLLADRYRALRLIGSGGFGKTFLAQDEHKPSLPRCAIKLFCPQTSGANALAKATQLFQQEAEQLEQLGTHPQIPNLLAHCEQEGHLYLVQEYIDGLTLARELEEEGVFNEKEIRALLNDLLPVLEFIHSHQIIHRDIKPDNIIRRRIDNKLVLVDFGGAKHLSETSLNKTGTSIGSVGYVAPEQSFGKAVFSSDLYSLAVTCIYLLTQISPCDLFDSREGEWVWRDYLLNNPVSTPLGAVLDQMLQSAPSRRYQSAREVLDDLNLEAKVIGVGNQEVGSIIPQESRSTRLGISYLLWLAGLAGFGGLHRFYNGKILTGLIWFFTFNLLGVGQIVDIFLIPGIVDKYQERLRSKMGLSPAGVPLIPSQNISQVYTGSEQKEVMKNLLDFAHKNGGKLSVTQAVMATGLQFQEAETLLKELTVTGYAKVLKEKGVVTYHFTELRL